jgi:ribulose 1,5-bisphosphate synthetase/thiazole synthase
MFMTSKTTSFFLSLLLLIQLSNAVYDIIVYSATPGGIAAAITAARASSSLKIAIIEPTEYIGGMVTAGGIGLNDIGLMDTSKFLAF